MDAVWLTGVQVRLAYSALFILFQVEICSRMPPPVFLSLYYIVTLVFIILHSS